MGDIIIQVEDVKYNFRRIHAPMHAVNTILKRKANMTKGVQENSKTVTPLPTKANTESYDILVEALGEVVHEYLKKKEY